MMKWQSVIGGLPWRRSQSNRTRRTEPGAMRARRRPLLLSFSSSISVRQSLLTGCVLSRCLVRIHYSPHKVNDSPLQARALLKHGQISSGRVSLSPVFQRRCSSRAFNGFNPRTIRSPSTWVLTLSPLTPLYCHRQFADEPPTATASRNHRVHSSTQLPLRWRWAWWSCRLHGRHPIVGYAPVHMLSRRLSTLLLVGQEQCACSPCCSPSCSPSRYFTKRDLRKDHCSI